MHGVAGPEDTHHRAEALRLIADSVAQQRQATAKALVLHPFSVMATLLLTGTLARYCSLRVLFTISTSLVVFALAGLFWITKDYLTLAANINAEWLENPTRTYNVDQKNHNSNSNGNSNGIKKHAKCEDPTILVSRLGEEVVGALVLRVVKRERKAYFRAWTVESSHRGSGIGSRLLEEGVKIAWGKGARCMEFDNAHANSYRALLPEFNGVFEEQEVKAKTLLTELLTGHKREKGSR